MIKSYLFFFWFTLTCCAFVQQGCRPKTFSYKQEPEGPEPVGWQYVEVNDTTEITLASLKKVFLYGRFEVRSTLWGEHSLVYCTRPHWKVLDVGEKHGWWLFLHRLRAWSRKSGPTLSVDGKTCFLWLDIEKQLTAIDVVSGKMRSLTRLPTHIMNYKADRHLDPGPVWRDKGVVHDAERNRVLFIIQQETNEEVAFWQRRPGRGGYQIVAVDLTDRTTKKLSGPDKLAGKVRSWDLSLNRREIYMYRWEGDKHFLEVRTFEGKLVRRLPVPKRNVRAISLSPSEETLLLDLREGSTFVLIDLQTNQIISGPSEAKEAAWSGATWSPDGKTIAYRRPWQLWLYDVESCSSSLLASREPTKVGEEHPAYFNKPEWSPTGDMIAVNIGGGYPSGSDQIDAPTLIIDLKRKTAMVFPGRIHYILWVPHLRPFRGE